MAVSVERYLTVCLSLRAPNVQHLYYTLPIMVFAFVFNIPRFFELETGTKPFNETVRHNGFTAT